MATVSQFQIYGPGKTLKSMGAAMQKETPHVHYFTRSIDEQQSIWVFLYEDQNTAVQSSRCVTCILSEYPDSLSLEIADIGRQSGFRGSQGLNEEPVYDQLIDFILDYSKQFGLTVQNKESE
ncbi:hypothetical protein QA596_12055 [Balneolales bacterium ANBcel1]|nr:hypothetical protein [Balneolales bacterium ANBcel1]